MSDLVLLVSKWYYCLEIGVLYVLTNFTVSVIKQSNSVYFIDWEISQGITPYSPFFGTISFTLAAIGWHMLLSLITQALRNRFESKFNSYPFIPISVSPTDPYVPS
jgi:hypothetical protein